MDLRAEKKSLKLLLALEDQQFRIPPYQRPYSWTAEQVDDLWEDLLSNASTGHFLGSIVMSTEDQMRPLVIDGQQRLTTIMMLMAVLRDQCHERGLAKQVQRIDKRLVADDLAEGDAYFKFKTGSANWKVFRDYVLRTPDDPERKDAQDAGALDHETRMRNGALLRNLNRLHRHVTGLLDSKQPADQVEWLSTFDKDLMEKVELVVIEVRELADAFLLFETLNDRGLQLSAADLLKSHLLGQIAKKAQEEEVEEAASDWDAMLEDLGADVDVSRYLRHYLLGSLQTVKKDEVFGEFKSLIAKQNPKEVLADLRKAAQIYGELEHPEKVAHEPTRRVLSDLQVLRATVCYVALLPARRYLSEGDFIEFAKLAETLTYRYSSVVGLGTNVLEAKYRDAAHVLNRTQGADVDAARAILIGAMPNSETFRLAFQNMRMGTQYLLRYTLQRIEEHVAPSVEKHIKANSLVHIEHIMPRKLNGVWRDELGPDVEFHDSYINRYGNLTLLYYALNIPASNNDFETKKQYYLDSQVEITRALTDQPSWGLEAIDARQRWLAEVADEVWAVPGQPVPATQPEAPDAVARFRGSLGELWVHVEPHCEESTPSEIEGLGVAVAAHVEHARASEQAQNLGRRLSRMLSDWADFDAAQRVVVSAAARYFLEPDDASPDHEADGFNDDAAVLASAELALGWTPEGPEHQPEANVEESQPTRTAGHDLRKQFDGAMREVYSRAKAEAGYDARAFLTMLAQHGGHETARRLLASASVSDGFVALWERNRIDLAVENVVLRDEFYDLFTEDERETARARLKEYGFDVD